MGKVIRRNHLAIRLKSTNLSFSGKQATLVKKGQKLPIVSSSPSSSEDNRPSKPTSSRQRILAKTVAVPARPQFPSLVSASTPSRAKIISSKSKHNLVSEAPGVQAIPYPQHSTPVVDLTASSSTSGNQGTEVPISIIPKSPSPTKDKLLLCADLIPISSDDESLVPKLQECTSSNLAASGLPTRNVSGLISEPVGNILSSSNSRQSNQTFRECRPSYFVYFPVNFCFAGQESSFCRG